MPIQETGVSFVISQQPQLTGESWNPAMTGTMTGTSNDGRSADLLGLFLGILGLGFGDGDLRDLAGKDITSPGRVHSLGASCDGGLVGCGHDERQRPCSVLIAEQLIR